MTQALDNAHELTQAWHWSLGLWSVLIFQLDKVNNIKLKICPSKLCNKMYLISSKLCSTAFKVTTTDNVQSSPLRPTIEVWVILQMGIPRLAILIIPLEIFQTWNILLHAHPKVVYYNCVEDSTVLVHPLRRSCAYRTYGQTDRWTQTYGLTDF